MDLKRIVIFCATILLFAGFAIDGFAQTYADPRGVRIRVDRIDHGAWAAIGDSIEVKVIARGIALENVVVTLVAPVDTITLDVGVSELDSMLTLVGGGNSVFAIEYSASLNVGATGELQTESKDVTTDGIETTFSFRFGVGAGDPESGNSQSLMAQAYVNKAGENFKSLNNQMTEEQESEIFSDKVGDGVLFGIDGQRPVNTAIFDSVVVDRSALRGLGKMEFPTDAEMIGEPAAAVMVGTSHNTIYSAGHGDEVAIKVHTQNILSSGAVAGEVHIYDADLVRQADPDSAFYSTTFDSRELLFGVRRTFKVADGKSGNQKKAFGNRQRVRLAAFLVDAAGNRSAAMANSSVPMPYYGGEALNYNGQTDGDQLVYIIDSEKPTVTPTRPKAGTISIDSLRFTPQAVFLVGLRGIDDDHNSALPLVPYPLMPMVFKVSEVLQSAAVTLGDTTVTVATADLGGLLSEDAFEIHPGVILEDDQKPGGNTLDVSIVVQDEVGNETTETIKGAIFDVVRPEFVEVFPSSGTVPEDEENSDKPTINPDTYQPTVRLKEALDSLEVRYVQIGGLHTLTYGVPSGSSLLSNVDKEYTLTFAAKDTLLDGKEYTLQLVAFDLAGNVAATEPDVLTFTKGFANPMADSFVVSAAGDSVITGGDLALEVTAIDSTLTREAGALRRAVTYETAGVRVRVMNADDVSGISFGGAGVTDNGDGTATLDGPEWSAGRREVIVKSTVELSDFSVGVEEVNAEDGTVNLRGDQHDLTVDAGAFTTYKVTALVDGVETTRVSGDFTVRVIPTDEYGNKSTKINSDRLLDSRLEDGDALEEILFSFSANIGGVGVPQGRLSVGPDGGEFVVQAPDRQGTGLVISVFSIGDDRKQTGSSKSLSFDFGVPPDLVGAPEPVSSVMVQDYLGADGQGDQGAFMLITFPNSASHSGATYRVYREITVDIDRAEDGGLETINPTNAWIAWTKIDAVPVPDGGSAITRAVVPALDNVATFWAIGVEKGGATSAQTVAAKRVFTKESVQQMVRLLGVDPNRVISQADLEKLITPPEDYVKSILGDLRGVVFAGLDPDLGRALKRISVPQTIRTSSGGEVLSSKLTISEHAVAAVDNIAPAEVSGANGSVTEEGNVNLFWTASADDKPVGSITYRGYHIPIDGVKEYEILRGTEEGDLAAVATVEKGSESYMDTDLPDGVSSLVYRVDALDLDNRTEGQSFQVGVIEVFGTDPVTGEPIRVYAMETSNNEVGFEDFLIFAGAFGKQPGERGYNINGDTNGDGLINLFDFINFVQTFGLTFDLPATKRVILAATPIPGVNDNTEMSLSLGGERVLAGQTISLDISMSNVQALTVFGLALNYDPDRFEFVEAAPADEDLLKSTGGDTPLFLSKARPGELKIANAVINGSAVSGEGSILKMTFKVLREFEDQARFEITEGIVFDPESHSNPVVTLGALQVESTPTEFTLLQNYPNPFNPETTIKYNLAEAGDVHLRIYNIVGQVVRTLVAERQPAGRYQVRWAGTDDRGLAVSSGIYFYQITAGKFQDVKRLMLLK